MVANNCWPMRLPKRIFGGVAMSRVTYASVALGPVGWLARRGRRGAVPRELGRAASEVRWVFDHAETWLHIDEDGRRHLDDRLLVAHPYHFGEKDRELLERAALLFDFVWTVMPPGASWYAPNAWLIIAHPRHLLPIPGEELQTTRRGLDRRPLRPGEFETGLWAEEREAETKRIEKRAYNKARYERLKKQPRVPIFDIVAGRAKNPPPK